MYQCYPFNLNGTTARGLMFGSPLHHAPTDEEGQRVIDTCTRVIMEEGKWLDQSAEPIVQPLSGEFAPSLREEMRICRIENFIWEFDGSRF